jgi:hypothetical protein
VRKFGTLPRDRGEQGNVVDNVLSRAVLYRLPIELGGVFGAKADGDPNP